MLGEEMNINIINLVDEMLDVLRTKIVLIDEWRFSNNNYPSAKILINDIEIRINYFGELFIADRAVKITNKQIKTIKEILDYFKCKFTEIEINNERTIEKCLTKITEKK